jgi:hypothetical protein
MRHIPRVAAFFLAVGFVLPLLAADEKKAPDPKKDLDKNPSAPKVNKVGEATGKVVAVYESKKMLRLQVQVPQLNQGAVAAIAQAEAQLQIYAATRNIGGIQGAQRTILQNQANLYTLHPKDFELQTTEDLKVRLNNPPPKFDDKGKIKKYTAKELKEMKGPDPKLPGYSGEFSDLQTEQIIQVTLVRPKGEKPVKPLPRPKIKGKDADMELLHDELPQVSQILVISDPNANAGK